MFISDAEELYAQYVTKMSKKYPDMTLSSIYVLRPNENKMRIKRNGEIGTLYTADDNGILTKLINFDPNEGFIFEQLIYDTRSCEFQSMRNSEFSLTESEFDSIHVDNMTDETTLTDLETFTDTKDELKRKLSDYENIIGTTFFIIGITAFVVLIASLLLSSGITFLISCITAIIMLIAGLCAPSDISRFINRKEIRMLKENRRINNNIYKAFTAKKSISPLFYIYGSDDMKDYIHTEDSEFFNSSKYGKINYDLYNGYGYYGDYDYYL